VMLSFISSLTRKTPSARAQAIAVNHLDDRRYARSPIKCRMQLGVHDTKGREVQLECQGMDMSSAGALVVSPAPIFVGAVVSIQCKELQLMGNATVRHCTEQKSKFRVGVEFRGSLTRTF
jgi:PilZ domain